jgi:hypothetical protein
MQANSVRHNLIVMTPKPLPTDLDGIRNKIAQVAEDVAANKKELNDYIRRPCAWTWAYWEHHRAKLTIILAALAATWYVYGLILDSHINGDSDEIDHCFRGHVDHSFRGHADQDRSEATLAFVILEK